MYVCLAVRITAHSHHSVVSLCVPPTQHLIGYTLQAYQPHCGCATARREMHAQTGAAPTEQSCV